MSRHCDPLVHWEGGTIPDTLYYPTDGGRFISSHPAEYNDCTIIALGTVLNIDYDVVHAYMKKLGRLPHDGVNFQYNLMDHAETGRKLFGYTVINHHFKPIRGRQRMYIAAFCVLYPSGKYILNCTDHMLACKDGVAWDVEWSPKKIVCNAFQFVK